MRNWAWRNRIAFVAAAIVALYCGFIEWIWGWQAILAQWTAVGFRTGGLALCLLVATYVIRTHRMQDYFPHQTAGRFLALFRITQIHNLLNIMLPFRAGETSFPLLMRSEFGVPLAQGTSALLVLRLLDLHALLAAAGAGLVLSSARPFLASALWAVFLALPLLVFPLRDRAVAMAHRTLPGNLSRIIDGIAAGLPAGWAGLFRAWLLTVFNWGIKVAVLAWVLGLMGVAPLAATFGGALGGEISSVLPVHAPAGVGTYPAGIAAGAAALGSVTDKDALAVLATASINTHLLILLSALAGTGLSLLLAGLARTRQA